MPRAMDFLSKLARERGGKQADHIVATACGVSDRTAKAWRYGELSPPERIARDLRRLRAERARRLIEEGKRELAELLTEEVQ